MSSIAGLAGMTSRTEKLSTWSRSDLKRLLVRAFTEGKGEDSQLHQSLIRLGIVTTEQCLDLIAALEAADELWKPLHRAFNAAHVTSTRRRYRIFPWLRKVGRHKRAGAMTVDEFRARALEVIASAYGLPGRGIKEGDDASKP